MCQVRFRITKRGENTFLLQAFRIKTEIKGWKEKRKKNFRRSCVKQEKYLWIKNMAAPTEK